MSDKLLALATTLAQKRVEASAHQQKEIKLFSALVKTPEWKASNKAKEGKSEVVGTMNKAYAALQNAMLDHEKETGEKSFDFGKVTDRKSFSIDNSEAAVAWAISHNHFGLLQPNLAEFKKVAGALNPPGVSEGSTKAVRINSDLSALLETVEETP